MDKKTFTEDEVVKAYQKVYKRIYKSLERQKRMDDVEKLTRQHQTMATLAALRHELGLDK